MRVCVGQPRHYCHAMEVNTPRVRRGATQRISRRADKRNTALNNNNRFGARLAVGRGVKIAIVQDERRGRCGRCPRRETQQKEDTHPAKTSQHGARARLAAGPAGGAGVDVWHRSGGEGGGYAVYTVGLDFFAASQVGPVAWRVRPSSPADVCQKRCSAGSTGGAPTPPAHRQTLTNCYKVAGRSPYGV